MTRRDCCIVIIGICALIPMLIVGAKQRNSSPSAPVATIYPSCMPVVINYGIEPAPPIVSIDWACVELSAAQFKEYQTHSDFLGYALKAVRDGKAISR